MARLGRAQPRNVFTTVRLVPLAGNHSSRTATDTIATLTETATRIVHTGLTATDTLATVTDTATRIVGLHRTASDTETAVTDTASASVGRNRTASDTLATVTDTASRAAQAFLRTATDALFAFSDAASVPSPTFTYLPAPANWQPWNVPSSVQVLSWDYEVYQGGGLGNPPPVNTLVLVANCAMAGGTLKVWILASQVEPLG